jgi:hypothetical protein
MHYMILEQFRRGPEPVYARFRERGRMAPAGLRYVGSWVTRDGARCFQVMECEDRLLLDEWMAAWADLADFEVIPVMTSAEAAAAFAPA